MTIKTLEFIHNLLKEEANKTDDAYKYIRDIATTARENEQPNADYLAQQQEAAWKKRTEAKHALEDFEEKEW